MKNLYFCSEYTYAIEGARVPEIELLYLFVSFLSIIVALIALYMMRTERKKRSEKLEEPPETESHLSFLLSKSVTQSEAEEAKNKLRILGLEKEILSYAIRRLYEAHAEGKISEEERDRLAEKYKEDTRRVNEDIAHGESIITLSELERMQDDLLKLFDARFGELNKRIEEMRTRGGITVTEPVRRVEKERPVSAEPSEVAKPSRERRRKEPGEMEPTPEKSEAERKVEQIMTEVEKVLARLEQIEVGE